VSKHTCPDKEVDHAKKKTAAIIRRRKLQRDQEPGKNDV
jgi:hypothetical protein